MKLLTRARLRARRPRGKPGTRPGPKWALLADEELLDLRFSELALSIEWSPLAARVEDLYGELAAKGLRFRPHVWLSTSWFSPDGVPGIAVPFYLAHPRLMRLELAQMGVIEGGTKKGCLKMLRHECGHAVASAYRMHRSRRWRERFGAFSAPYKILYHANPRSRDFVTHLDGWYAQSHPCEDFAETFAVWLRPRSHWEERYADWPALAKLEYLDDEIEHLADRPPHIERREKVEPLAKLATTLREHYRRRRKRYHGTVRTRADEALLEVFVQGRRDPRARPASPWMRGMRRVLTRTVANEAELELYVVDQTWKRLTERARALDLRTCGSDRRMWRESRVLLNQATRELLATRSLAYHR